MGPCALDPAMNECARICMGKVKVDVLQGLTNHLVIEYSIKIKGLLLSDPS